MGSYMDELKQEDMGKEMAINMQIERQGREDRITCWEEVKTEMGQRIEVEKAFGVVVDYLDLMGIAWDEILEKSPLSVCLPGNMSNTIRTVRKELLDVWKIIDRKEY